MEVSYNQTTEDYVSKIKKIWFLGGVNSGVVFFNARGAKGGRLGTNMIVNTIIVQRYYHCNRLLTEFQFNQVHPNFSNE